MDVVRDDSISFSLLVSSLGLGDISSLMLSHDPFLLWCYRGEVRMLYQTVSTTIWNVTVYSSYCKQVSGLKTRLESEIAASLLSRPLPSSFALVALLLLADQRLF